MRFGKAQIDACPDVVGRAWQDDGQFRELAKSHQLARPAQLRVHENEQVFANYGLKHQPSNRHIDSDNR